MLSIKQKVVFIKATLNKTQAEVPSNTSTTHYMFNLMVDGKEELDTLLEDGWVLQDIKTAPVGESGTIITCTLTKEKSLLEE